MTDPLLEVRDLAVSFGEKTVIRNVNLSVAAGQIVVITGESGVGKSSLLRAIAGLGPFRGEIRIRGVLMNNHGQGSDRRPCILVTQQPNLWEHMTALDNVSLVRRIHHGEPVAQARRKAMEFLALLQVDHLAHRYPLRLSGGEQQRVSLARGLAVEAPLLLLDEITANIDPDRRRAVASILTQMAGDGTSIVLVSHDFPTARSLTANPLVLTADGLSTLP